MDMQILIFISISIYSTIQSKKMTVTSILSLDEMISKLKLYKQEHIYQTIPDFNTNHPIFKQLCEIDIEQSLKHLNDAQQTINNREENYIPVSHLINLQEISMEETEIIHSIGIKAISHSKVAAVIMSGGQGTRLGYKGPKGMYQLNIPSNKSIFQIHIEKILKIKNLCCCSDRNNDSISIPIYIMTSNLNHHIIIDYFKTNNYFNYPSEDIIFFEQGVEPSFTFDGKIIIESLSSLSLAPDGNGGIYRALLENGCIHDMIQRGIEHLHIYGIDNILTKSLDPLFLGACIKDSVECGNKVIWRANKNEKVGVTAELNNKMHILEYSEIPIHLAESIDDNGKLCFGAANICNHYLSLKFLNETILPNLSSNYHIANKKIPYLDPNTFETIEPNQNNGIKIEMFIFDVFPLANKWIVIESLREDEFAPVKNAPGSETDSPDTAINLLSNQAKKWLQSAGAKLIEPSIDMNSKLDMKAGTIFKLESSSIIHCDDKKFENICEISSLLSYNGEGLECFNGQTIHLPCYLY